MAGRGYGYLHLSRKQFDGQDLLWADGSEYDVRSAWTDLMQMAAFKAHRKLVQAQVIELKRGELLASLRFLGERWKWSKNRVARFLQMLEDEGRIRTAGGTPAGTVYGLVNYDTYQSPWDTKRYSERGDGGTDVGQARDKEDKGKVMEKKEDQDREPRAREDSGAQPDTEEETNGDRMADRRRYGAGFVRLHVRGSPGVEDPLRLLLAAEDARDTYTALLACWAAANHPEGVPGSVADQQSEAGWRLVDRHDNETLARMVFGIGFLFPHSAGEGWNLRDLELKGDKALKAARDGGARKRTRADRNLEAILSADLS